MFVKKTPLAALFVLGLALSPLLRPETAEAIPAFSRHFKTECSTCHTIYPELNEFGEAFLKNNYVWPGKKPAAVEQVGAEGEKPKNEWAFLSGLPEQIPISLTGTVDLAYDKDAFDGDKLALSARSLRLQAGGTYREAAAFFLTYNLYTQGAQTGQVSESPVNNGNVPPNNTPNLSEMFLVWRQALDTPINLKIGRFEPKLSLWKRSDRVIEVPSYASTAYLVGNSPFSVDSPEDGLEANAVLFKRLLIAGGVVDRKGENHKDAYGHASLKIGGTDYKGNEPEIDFEKESIWDYLTVTTGAFGYSGRDGQYSVLGIMGNFNDFYRVGAEMDILYKRFHLKGSGTFGRDSNPLFSVSAPVAFDSHAYAFEGEYYLGAPVNVIPLFRYEYQEGVRGTTRRYIPAIAYAPLQNTKLSLEYIYQNSWEGINRTALASLAFSL